MGIERMELAPMVLELQGDYVAIVRLDFFQADDTIRNCIAIRQWHGEQIPPLMRFGASIAHHAEGVVDLVAANLIAVQRQFQFKPSHACRQQRCYGVERRVSEGRPTAAYSTSLNGSNSPESRDQAGLDQPAEIR